MDEQENKIDDYEQIDDIIPKPYSATSANTQILEESGPEFEEISVDKIGIIEEIPGEKPINQNNESFIENNFNNVINQDQPNINNSFQTQSVENDYFQEPEPIIKGYSNPQFSGAIIDPNTIQQPIQQPINDPNFVNPAVAAYSEAYHEPEKEKKSERNYQNRNLNPISGKELLVWLVIFIALFGFILLIPTIDKFIENIF